MYSGIRMIVKMKLLKKKRESKRPLTLGGRRPCWGSDPLCPVSAEGNRRTPTIAAIGSAFWKEKKLTSKYLLPILNMLHFKNNKSKTTMNYPLFPTFFIPRPPIKREKKLIIKPLINYTGCPINIETHCNLLSVEIYIGNTKG